MKNFTISEQLKNNLISLLNEAVFTNIKHGEVVRVHADLENLQEIVKSNAKKK